MKLLSYVSHAAHVLVDHGLYRRGHLASNGAAVMPVMGDMANTAMEPLLP